MASSPSMGTGGASPTSSSSSSSDESDPEEQAEHAKIEARSGREVPMVPSEKSDLSRLMRRASTKMAHCGSMLDDDAKRNIFTLLTEGPQECQRRRSNAFAYYKARKHELEGKEAELHPALAPPRARILEGKALLLFREACKDAGVEDDELTIAFQVEGTLLTGMSGASSLFEASDATPPAMSDEQLMRSARWGRWASWT